MSRIRNIKPEFFVHEDLQELEVKYPGQYIMLTFSGLWTICDKHGVFPYKPKINHLSILPFIPFDFKKTLDILERHGYFTRFESDGNQYAIIGTFNKHQAISGKEKDSAFQYPEPRYCKPATCQNNAAPVPVEFQDSSAPVPVEVKTALTYDVLTYDVMNSDVMNTMREETASLAASPTPSATVSRARFKKPTVEEVASYCRERENDVDAEHFHAYYESNGWRVGRNPMKDWHGAVHTWEKNEFQKGKNHTPEKQLTDEEKDFRRKLGLYVEGDENA